MIGMKRAFSNYFTYGVHSIIGPGKKKGEDAHYQSPSLLSIADGVGGWTTYGIDPSKYAWELIKNIEKSSTTLKPSEKTSYTIIKQAAATCKETGTSTCCIVLLNSNKPLIDTINIGDSGFYLYRKVENSYTLIDKSKDVVHGFNFPFQLGTDGDSVIKASAKILDVQDKDIIILYTDGLSDNLFEDMIRQILIEKIETGLDGVARALAEKALEKSTDQTYFSPFAKSALEMINQKYIGGKPDDITVIVAQVNFGKVD